MKKTKPSVKRAIEIAKSVRESISQEPPDEGYGAESEKIIPCSVVRNTRGYIEVIANQINGCYEKGWYDACAVMVRRLIETLIV